MNVDKPIFRWDRYSDQPATIHRRIRRGLRRHGVRDEPRKWLASLLLPRFLLQTWLSSNRFEACRNDDRIGLCINLERPLEDKKILSGSDIAEIIRPLNLSRIAVRIPLHDIDRLEEYVAFIEQFPEHEILVVVLQEREHIEDRAKLERSLRRIFAALSGTVGRYQIGNAVNRLKWGFLSQREYLEFFETAWNLRNREFPSVKLLGGAVIDFELHEHCGSLFNRFPFRYDGYASLLYVDRRGAPENRQFGFDLPGKIDLLARLVASSGKVQSRGEVALWITEVNWPLQDTGRYAPSLDDCRVGEREQLRFLVRYFLLALATGSIAACFWHQLVAPGYGLIDNRGGAVRMRPAFHGFATLCRLFNGAEIVGFERPEELGYYRLTARKDGAEVVALWRSGGEASIPMPPGKRAIGIEGDALAIEDGAAVPISESVIYLVDGSLPGLADATSLAP